MKYRNRKYSIVIKVEDKWCRISGTVEELEVFFDMFQGSIVWRLY